MKKFNVFVFLLFLMNVLPLSSPAQGSGHLFAVVEFMKVEAGRYGEYINLEQEIWKPMHEERLKRGKIVGWYLYSINFTGSNDEYNYAVVNLYGELDSLENPWDPDIPSLVHPKIPMSEILERTRNTRKTVRSELYHPVVNLPEKIPLVPSKYLLVSFMQVKPYQGTEYEELESNIWRPVHSSLIDEDILTSWNVWRVVFPRGSDRNYQYITMDGVSKYRYIYGIPYQKNFSMIHPGEKLEEFQQKTQDSRTTARTELWELIDFISK